ncbi:MAG: NotI family restriction endonuclease [Acidobacteriaceae bacterium]
MARQPIAELFGFPPNSETEEAQRYRRSKLCPYNNKVPSCTKDSVVDPLGVCTIHHGDALAVICPVRLRQDWIIADHAAGFFFPASAQWTTLVEVRLKDKSGKSAGNIDVVLVSYDQQGTVIDFGSLEVQTVYISGNLRRTFFKPLMEHRQEYLATDWQQSRKKNPGPDYLSSSRKRLAPQLIFKGGILKAWNRKQAVAVHSAFFETLPDLPAVPKAEADIAWLIYDLIWDEQQRKYTLTLVRTVYTKFRAALNKITVSKPGSVDEFIANLQIKLDAKLEGASLAQLADVSADVPADEPDLLDELENL